MAEQDYPLVRTTTTFVVQRFGRNPYSAALETSWYDVFYRRDAESAVVCRDKAAAYQPHLPTRILVRVETFVETIYET